MEFRSAGDPGECGDALVMEHAVHLLAVRERLENGPQLPPELDAREHPRGGFVDHHDHPLAVEGHVLKLGTIQWWLSRLASIPVADRKLIVGLHPDRARAIVAGVVILIEIMRAFNLEEIECSEHDILYGGAIKAAASIPPPRLAGSDDRF